MQGHLRATVKIALLSGVVPVCCRWQDLIHEDVVVPKDLLVVLLLLGTVGFHPLKSHC